MRPHLCAVEDAGVPLYRVEDEEGPEAGGGSIGNLGFINLAKHARALLLVTSFSKLLRNPNARFPRDSSAPEPVRDGRQLLWVMNLGAPRA